MDVSDSNDPFEPPTFDIKQRFTDQLLGVIERKCKDPRMTQIVNSLVRESVLNPLKYEIQEGELDSAIAGALVRISMPIIVVLALIFLMILILLNVTVMLAIKVNRIVN